MIYFLYDQPLIKGKFEFIIEHFKKNGKEIQVFGSPYKNYKLLNWLEGCINILYKSNKNDTIICWYDFQAILLYWLSFITFQARKIVCINILLKEKKTWKNKLVTWMYKQALISNRLIASVTSIEYGNYLKKRLKIKNIFLIHDVFHNYPNNINDSDIIPNSVFCGGRNGRNWKFIINVARITPDISFYLVMPKSLLSLYNNDLPSNIHILCDIPFIQFMKVLNKCQLVALPLDTESPAGLIVFFHAARNKKLIITTDTMTTREYFTNERGILLPNDANIWSTYIHKRMIMTKENSQISEYLLNFLKNECSEEKFAEGVYNMTKHIEEVHKA